MISIETWLKSFGFVRNPFEATEAGGESRYIANFLHETFVKPQDFDEILGHPAHPKSSLVFAARGKGKTSTRLMTAHFCREGIFPKEMGAKKDGVTRVLPVHHTRFERLVGVNGLSALVDAHVFEIIIRAVPAMVDMMIIYPEISEGINKLDVLRRLELQYFLMAFKSQVPFQEYKIARDIVGNELVALDETRTPIGFSLPDSNRQRIDLSLQEIESHIVAYSKMQPIDLLGRFAELMSNLGFGAVYVLVDGLDEIPETADDFAAAAGLLIPLLSNLNLMTNMPYVAFKIFVPSEMEPLLLKATRKVRRDRLAVQRISLQNDDLAEILHRRLVYCSNGAVSHLDAICTVEMRGQLEKELILYAEGNPRRLVLLGRSMLEHRCRLINADENQEAYLLNKDDLNWAVHALRGDPAQSIVAEAVKENMIAVQPDATLQPTAAASVSGDWLRNELPAPIALSYLVYQRESVAHVRIWKMYELVEASLAFLSQVLIALLYQNLNKDTPLQLQRSGLRFERTSLGLWRIALEKLPGMLSGFGVRSSFARACQRLVNKHNDFLVSINDERNRSAHGGPQSEKACEALINQFSQPLQQYLEGLGYLRESRLIKVLHVHKHENRFIHHGTSYTGDAIVFPVIDIECDIPLDSGYLWIINSDGCVNLHPLIFANAESNILGESLWLYQGIDKETVIYKSYGMGKTLGFSKYFQEIQKVMPWQ